MNPDREKIRHYARSLDHDLETLRDDEYDWYRVHNDGNITAIQYNELLKDIHAKRIVIQAKILDLENQIGEQLRNENRPCWLDQNCL